MKKLAFILLFIFLVGCSAADNETNAAFVRVVDGDTIIANVDGKEEYIRLLLIDTPETKHPDKGIQPFGPEASNTLKELLASGEKIMVEYGTTKRDKYDRLLAYVYTNDGKMINKLLLEKGLARVAYVYPPNDKYADQFRGIETEAKKRNRGIWSISGYVTDDGFKEDAVKEVLKEERKIPYDPNGPDRDCSDFTSQQQAQAFFEAAGGPEKDPHRLDGENDGKVCESLP